MPGVIICLGGAAARCTARIGCGRSGLRLTDSPPGILACLDRIRKQVTRQSAVPGTTLKHRTRGAQTQVRQGRQANGKGCNAAPAVAGERGQG